MAKLFQSVRGFRPARSVHNLSHTKLFTGDMGELYPVFSTGGIDCIPGDVFSLSANVVLRLMPMVAPILHRVNVFVHYFFVPYRLLWDAGTDDNWEDFITGGEDGTDAGTIPTWSPSDVTVGSLWDHMGFPMGITPDADNRPVDWTKRSYNLIWNEFYRSEDLQTALTITTAEAIQKRAWQKDYFTSASIYTSGVKGTAPSLPVTLSGTLSAVWPAVSAANQATLYRDNTANQPYDAGTKTTLENNTIDLSAGSASTVDITELRLTISIQKWMERNARGGSRYIEFLRAHHGVSPTDQRLDRPEMIGAIRAPVIVSEVLATSDATGASDLGTMAGHGISAGTQHAGRYHVKEFGLIMGMLSVMPEPMYAQGINKQWTRTTRYDYYNSAFAHLSEQGIERKELFANGTKADNETIFGYQGIFDEYRYIPSGVSGKMNFGEDFDHWNVCRDFASAPTLNSTFVECDPRKDWLAVEADPTFVCHVGNIVRAARPIPAIATPGVNRI